MTECSKSLIPNYIEDVVSCGLGFTFALFLETYLYEVFKQSATKKAYLGVLHIPVCCSQESAIPCGVGYTVALYLR